MLFEQADLIFASTCIFVRSELFSHVKRDSGVGAFEKTHSRYPSVI